MRRAVWAPLLLLPVVPLVLPADAARQCTGVVNVSRTADRGEGEESLSVNPRNPQQILVGSNQFSPSSPGSPVSAGGLMEAASWVSQDGGCTWRALGLETLGGIATEKNPLPVGPAEYRNVGNVVSSDQHSVWDSKGDLWYEAGFLGGLGVDGDQRAMVWHSRDGGRTFDTPVVAYSGNTNKAPAGSAYPDTVPELDRPWLAVQPDGRVLYMTLATGPFAFGLPAEVYVLSSRDGARTWGRTTRVDTGTYSTQQNPREMPAVGSDGALYVVYDVAPLSSTTLPAPQVSPIGIWVARSTDGGRTFTRTLVDGDVHRVTDPEEALPAYIETITSIAANPLRAGHLAIAWPEADRSGDSHIVLRRSTDGGRHWGPREHIAGTATPDQQDHVTLTYTPQGELVVVWRDRQYDGGSWSSPLRVWARMPGHLPVQVTTGAQAPTSMHRGGPTMPSEFLGVAATRTELLVSWDQLVGDLPDNVFRAIPLAALR